MYQILDMLFVQTNKTLDMVPTIVSIAVSLKNSYVVTLNSQR